MFDLHGKLGKSKYGWEVSMFNKYREFRDGISFLESKINFDKYESDHTPRFDVLLVIMNFTIFELSVYNVYHMDHPDYES